MGEEMKLAKLLENVEYKVVSGSVETEVNDIIYDSRKAAPGAAFFCLTGSRADGHKYAADAVGAGCMAVIVSKPVELPENITVIMIKNERQTLARMSAALFGYPARDLKTIGITGTKGKTTMSYMIKAILEAAGKKTGLIGTNGVLIGEKKYPTKNTTPESYEIQKYLSMMRDDGCEYLVMEVSSQGLKTDRVEGIFYDIGIFSNISPDHIGKDEHADFEEYLFWKSSLLQRCRVGLVNIDDPHFEEIIKDHTCRLLTYSLNGKADFTASDVTGVHYPGFMGSEFCYSGKEAYRVLLDIPGVYNVYNALAAICAAELLDISKEAVLAAMKTVKVAGRMQIAYSGDRCTVIVDYAHNGVSAKSMLETLKEYNPKRLVVVFGCGGDRDPHRRYEMGEAVGKAADLAVITNDNPRFEAPENIIKDIHKGFDPTGCPCVEIPDRREAIAYAIERSQAGDVIAIIGKGHEDYQEVRGVRTHLSDVEEVEKTIKKTGW